MSRPVIQTVSGYSLDEVVSALQKAIRRGDERQAVYWAVEIDKSGYGNYAWKRLKIISAEDVSINEVGISTEIWALFSMWQELSKKKDHNAPLFLIKGTILLCRAKKNRMVCDATVLHYETAELVERLEIPDYALDQHTVRGKRMQRGVKHFLESSAKLENEDTTIENPYYVLWTEYWLEKESKPEPANGKLFDVDAFTSEVDSMKF